jgi:ABC-2 type transport system ATP-binding protein
MMTAGDAMLSARDVVRRFGPLLAVDHADLEVRSGEIVGLLGANGAGKTTLIRIVLGLLAADGGAVRLFGLPPSRATRRRLGYVPQGLGLWEDLSVTENLDFTGRAFRQGAESTAAAADGDLAAASRTLVRDLPLGLRRRLAFAAALAHDPDLLVLDEPTSGVDPLARARLWDTVHETVERGKGALVTTHYMDEAEQCDRLVVMSEGRVVAAGSAAAIVGDRTAVTIQTEDWAAAFALLDTGGEAAALVGRDLRVPGADPDRIQRLLAAGGVTARTSLAPATFEEVFVALSTERGTLPAPRIKPEAGDP